MKRERRVIGWLALASQLLTGGVALAESGPSSGHTAPAQRTATDAVKDSQNAVPTATQLIFEPQYTFPNGESRYIAELLFQANLPYDGFIFPGLDVSGFRSIARVEINGESLEQITSNRPMSASGLTDLDFVDGVLYKPGPLFEGGLGFGTVFPMATDPALGQGKWQLGPAALFDLVPVHWLQVGAVVQALWSIAGDSTRSGLAYVAVQPIVSLILPADCSLYSNNTMNFYWKGPGTTVPLTLGFGHGFSEHFVGNLQGTYTVSGVGQGNIQGALVLNFQP
jgi:hypothetical protein